MPRRIRVEEFTPPMLPSDAEGTADTSTVLTNIDDKDNSVVETIYLTITAKNDSTVTETVDHTDIETVDHTVAVPYNPTITQTKTHFVTAAAITSTVTVTNTDKITVTPPVITRTITSTLELPVATQTTVNTTATNTVTETRTISPTDCNTNPPQKETVTVATCTGQWSASISTTTVESPVYTTVTRVPGPSGIPLFQCVSTSPEPTQFLPSLLFNILFLFYIVWLILWFVLRVKTTSGFQIFRTITVTAPYYFPSILLLIYADDIAAAYTWVWFNFLTYYWVLFVVALAALLPAIRLTADVSGTSTVISGMRQALCKELQKWRSGEEMKFSWGWEKVSQEEKEKNGQENEKTGEKDRDEEEQRKRERKGKEEKRQKGKEKEKDEDKDNDKANERENDEAKERESEETEKDKDDDDDRENGENKDKKKLSWYRSLWSWKK